MDRPAGLPFLVIPVYDNKKTSGRFLYGVLWYAGAGLRQCADVKGDAGAGMTGVRLNLSHGDLEENGHWIRMVQEAGRELHSQVQILMDLRGPELRLGRFKEEIQAEEGSWLVLGDGGLPVPEEALAYVCPGDRILIDDGKVELEAEAGAAPSAGGCRITAPGGPGRAHKVREEPGH